MHRDIDLTVEGDGLRLTSVDRALRYHTSLITPEEIIAAEAKVTDDWRKLMDRHMAIVLPLADYNRTNELLKEYADRLDAAAGDIPPRGGYEITRAMLNDLGGDFRLIPRPKRPHIAYLDHKTDSLMVVDIPMDVRDVFQWIGTSQS